MGGEHIVLNHCNSVDLVVSCTMCVVTEVELFQAKPCCYFNKADLCHGFNWKRESADIRVPSAPQLGLRPHLTLKKCGNKQQRTQH